jgi:hypothetical protein
MWASLFLFLSLNSGSRGFAFARPLREMNVAKPNIKKSHSAVIFSLFDDITGAGKPAFCMYSFDFLGFETRFYLLAIYVHVNKR